jgi:uncharacterized protein
MSRNAQAWRPGRTGVRVLVRVTPKSAQDSIDGMMQTAEGLALKVRVRAVADKGEANRSVESVVAQWLGVAKTRVTVAGGGKSRLKVLDIDGATADLQNLIAARIAALQ